MSSWEKLVRVVAGVVLGAENYHDLMLEAWDAILDIAPIEAAGVVAKMNLTDRERKRLFRPGEVNDEV